MIVLKYVKSTGEKIVCEYPVSDAHEPVYRLDDDIVYYKINNGVSPEINPAHSAIEYDFKLTENQSDQYPHLLIAKKIYTVVPLPNGKIISTLNDSVGEWIESNLPIWKQIKYVNKLAKLKAITNKTTDQTSEIEYIESVFDWVDQCRNLRDQNELELTNKGIMPSFEWPIIPQKNK